MRINRIILVAMLLASVTASAKLTVTKTTCNMRDGLVVTEEAPMLGWQMVSHKKTEKQEAYQILLSSAENGKTVLDTKKVKSGESQHIRVNIPAGEYKWKVRV